MARPLVVQFRGSEVPFQLQRITRSDLYGYVETEALDEQGRTCRMVKISSDGRTLVGHGGTALGMLSQDGEWLERKSLRPVNPDGKTLQPVQSSFSNPVMPELTATVDEYLSHNIRAVYRLDSDGEPGPIADELRKGTILTFPFSYRGGLEPDVGFLLMGADGNIFLALGKPTRIRFAGLDQAAGAEEEEAEEEVEDEGLDFGML